MSSNQAHKPRQLTQQDLQHVVCPVCYAPLHLQSARVLCTGCGLYFPVVDGLPVLLAHRAE